MNATVVDFASEVTVEQQYYNGESQAIEIKACTECVLHCRLTLFAVCVPAGGRVHGD